MGLFDLQPDSTAFGITNPSVLGLLAGLGQAAAPSRMPVPFGSVIGQAAGGLLGGQQAGLQMQKMNQGINTEAIQNASLLSGLRATAAALGLKPPSMEDIRSGKWQGFDWGSLFNQNAGTGGVPTPINAGGIPAGAPPAMPSQGIPQVPAGGASSFGGKSPPLAGAGQVSARLAMMGYGPEDRAAVLGNAAWESQLNPTAVGDNGASLGLWQWQKDRRAGLEQYAQQTNRPATNSDVQVEYMDHELRQRAPEFFDPNKSLAEKTRIFQDKFELPAKDTAPQRTQLAQNFLGNQTSFNDAGGGGGGQGLPQQIPDLPDLRQMAINRAFRSALGYTLTPVDQEIMAAASARPGSVEQRLHWLNAYKTAGLEPTLNLRQGGMGYQLNPTTGKYEMVAQAPKLPPGGQLNVNPDTGALSTSTIPGTIGGIASTSRAQASGPAGFRPEMIYGPQGQPYQGTALDVGMGIGGAVAGAGQPQGAAGAPQGGGYAPPPAGVGGALTPQAPATPGAPASLRPEAAAPAFPVPTPAGPKDISAVGINDLFPGGQGVPTPPPPPGGLGYGPPSKIQEERQKDDATRVEGYSKEAAENQKIYQDLAHLRDVMDRGLSTGKLAPAFADMTNIARQLGVEGAIPRGADPNDAAVFSKAATDLVFAAVKKLAGQVKVAEIQGYQQANPNITLPPAANYSIINDVLSAGKWQDMRAKLANEYVTQYPGAPLSAFDARFNEIAPLAAVTDRYRDRMIQLGAQMPGQEQPAKATAKLPPVTQEKTIGGTTYHKIGDQWYPVIK